jgi:vacuolar-type H+-ATPase subunit H
MTITDARRALREMVEILEPEHVEEVQDMIARAEREAADEAAQAKHSGPKLVNGANP